MSVRFLIAWLWNLGTPGSPLPVLSVGAAILFSIQLHRDIYDVDIFWQLKLGEITLKSGLPANEPFLAGKQSEPLVVVAWLAQAAYAIVRWSGGWPLLRLVDAAVWFGGLYIVARFFARRGGNDWPALAGLIIGWIAAIPHASIRPQSWAMPCLGLLIVLVQCRWPARRKLVTVAILLVTWQNLHPTVLLGIGYLGIMALFEWLKWLKGNENQRWLTSGLTLLAIVATILTPAGFSIFAVSDYNKSISMYRGITEWHPMWWYDFVDYGRDYSWIAFGLMSLVLQFAVVDRLITGVGKIRAADIVALIAFTAATLWMHRFSMFWGVVAIPVVANALSFGSPLVPRNRWRGPVAFAALILAILPPMIAKPAPFYNYYPFPAVEKLKASGFRGVILCDYFWGGILSDAGHPDWKVTHDGRYYLFSREDWDRYDRMMAGSVPLEETLRRHRPDAIFLRIGWGDGLSQQLGDDWTLLFKDRQTLVYVRKSP